MLILKFILNFKNFCKNEISKIILNFKNIYKIKNFKITVKSKEKK